MVTGKDAHAKEPQEPAAAKHTQLKFVYEVKLQIIFFSFSIFFPLSNYSSRGGGNAGREENKSLTVCAGFH